jgi:cytochrome c biogenesis protein CcmG, thiol:disulfide interchange protein DsbE
VSSRLPVLLGLIAGALAAVGLIVGAALLVPDAVLPVHDEPSVPPVLAATPSPALSASPQASGNSAASASLSPSGGQAPSGVAANFHVGQPAPALALPQVGGGTIDLAKLKGKPVWVDFTATWCPTCRDEFRQMNGFSARYADKGLVVIAVDVREDEGIVASFAQATNATFPIGLDGDGSAQARWGAYALPVHYWIDARGIVRDGALGGIGPDIMAKGLESIMPGVDVTP